jgi:hypothetical protein
MATESPDRGSSLKLADPLWEDKKRGLKKELVSFEFRSIVKANDLAKCLVEIQAVENWDPERHRSNYLTKVGEEFWWKLGSAVTPVDCYIEIFLKEMLTNEISKCSISTKSGTIEIRLHLKRVEFSSHYHEKSTEEIFKIAKKYKENGVKMFKDYPLFAHDYFNKAAKCLLSYSPFDGIDEFLIGSGLYKKDFEDLLENLYLNISLCLIKQERFEEVLHILKFVVEQDSPSEKAIFRLATAHFHLKQFDLAKSTIELIDYKNNKDLLQLFGKVQQHSKADDVRYSNMVRKMFG